MMLWSAVPGRGVESNAGVEAVGVKVRMTDVWWGGAERLVAGGNGTVRHCAKLDLRKL